MRSLPGDCGLLAPAAPARTRDEKARRPKYSACGPVAGWGEQKLLLPGTLRLSAAPVRPGRLESQGPLPSPRFEPPGSNGRYRSTLGSVAGDSASRLGRQAATPVATTNNLSSTAVRIRSIGW